MSVCSLLEQWAPKIGQIIWVTPRESYDLNRQLLDGLVTHVSVTVVIKEDSEASGSSLADRD